jgi:uncharacterized membrane-anchored protein
MSRISSILAVAVTMAIANPVVAETYAQAFPQSASRLTDEGRKVVEPLDFKQGDVSLADGHAKLSVPKGYFFLDPASATQFLTRIWRNPNADGILGLLVPAGKSPLTQSAWAIAIEYDNVGYVSDTDAASTDYQSLLQTMKDDTEAANAKRKADGFEAVHLIGWAEPPHYDANAHALYWAKELAFDGQDDHTLNFNVRMLGRKGVLVMNFIAPISRLSDVKAAVPDVLAMTSFEGGNRYQDFSPSVDRVAAVGLAGLIAGTAAVKPGLFVLGLLLLKKFFILLLAPLYWLKSKLKRRKQSDDA